MKKIEMCGNGIHGFYPSRGFHAPDCGVEDQSDYGLVYLREFYPEVPEAAVRREQIRRWTGNRGVKPWAFRLDLDPAAKAAEDRYEAAWRASRRLPHSECYADRDVCPDCRPVSDEYHAAFATWEAERERVRREALDALDN